MILFPSPAPDETKIVWKREGIVLEESKMDTRIKVGVSGEHQYLEVRLVALEDAGKYTVEGSSVGGSVSSSATVTIQPRPKEEEKKPQEEEEVQAQEEVKVEAEVKAGAPELAVTLEGVSVKVGETIKLTCKVTGTGFYHDG